MTIDAETRHYRDGLEARAMALFSEVPALLGVLTDAHEIGMVLGEAYCGLFDADYCRFWWRTDDAPVVQVLSHYPPIVFTEDWEHVKRLDDDRTSVVKSIFLEGQYRIETDATAIHDAEQRYATVYGALSGAQFPISVEGKVVGNMVLVSKREKLHFDPADVPILSAMAAVAGLAITCAQRAA